MRKIYSFLPLPFNKFAIFALYGLLSIALITLAQQDAFKSDDCSIKKPLTAVPQDKKTIGYVQLFTSQRVDPNKIPWNKYDYINVIGKNKKSTLFFFPFRTFRAYFTQIGMGFI